MINLVVFVTSIITTLDNLLQMIWGFVTDTVRQFPFLPVYISDVWKVCILHHGGVMSPIPHFSETWTSCC